MGAVVEACPWYKGVTEVVTVIGWCESFLEWMFKLTFGVNQNFGVDRKNKGERLF